jgi:hypothetical protein
VLHIVVVTVETLLSPQLAYSDSQVAHLLVQATTVVVVGTVAQEEHAQQAQERLRRLRELLLLIAQVD